MSQVPREPNTSRAFAWTEPQATSDEDPPVVMVGWVSFDDGKHDPESPPTTHDEEVAAAYLAFCEVYLAAHPDDQRIADIATVLRGYGESGQASIDELPIEFWDEVETLQDKAYEEQYNSYVYLPGRGPDPDRPAPIFPFVRYCPFESPKNTRWWDERPNERYPTLSDDCPSMVFCHTSAGKSRRSPVTLETTNNDECGTLAGFYRHLRNNETWCSACMAAHMAHCRIAYCTNSLRRLHYRLSYRAARRTAARCREFFLTDCCEPPDRRGRERECDWDCPRYVIFKRRVQADEEEAVAVTVAAAYAKKRATWEQQRANERAKRKPTPGARTVVMPTLKEFQQEVDGL